VTRIPYFPREAAKALDAYSCLVLVDAKKPVAMFGYAAGPRHVVNLPDSSIWDIDAHDVGIALRKLARAAGVPEAALSRSPAIATPPRQECPELRARSSSLTPSLLCAVVAALQPPGAIVVDEALTSGTDYWARSASSPPFSHLTLTGGAIGQGPPAAVGAAIACPHRRVINLQADGSGLYSAQALWTQARERLNVVTLVCANHKYNILKIELALQRVPVASGAVTRSLTDLGEPKIDWVALAKGFGVPHAVRVATVGALVDELEAALKQEGPTLIEVMLP
jgi:acetolactate synthase-1/2/3 large subunit